jgi:cysteine desulfurase
MTMVESVSTPVYLDYQATTPVDERVLNEMMPYFTANFGNAASRNHEFGRIASVAVESAREIVGRSINAKPQDIIFTSGATESINLAIKGAFAASEKSSPHFITVATEHSAVLDTMKRIQVDGAEVTILPVDGKGFVDLDLVAQAIKPNTVMISVMAANNEIGVLQPLKDIGNICRDKDVFFMTDATQAIGKIPIDIESMNIDLLACSAHKIYGPKGVGALFCRRSLPRVPILPLIDGGGHERGLRSGTLNVPGIVGFGSAISISTKEMKAEQSRLLMLRNTLLADLQNGLDVRLNGDLEKRLAGNLNLSIAGVLSDSLMIALSENVALSTGSACTTARVEPSHVLLALGLSLDQVRSSIRIGIGRNTKMEEIKYAGECILREAKRISSLNH